ncbi:MAG TPA: DUF3105 domain-containing protein, partial [Labilithrix sp.]
MTTRFGVCAVVSLTSLALAVGCAAQTGDEEADPISNDADITSTAHLAAGGTTTVKLNAKSDGAVTVTVDCRPPADPDDVGPVIDVDAPEFGTASKDPSRAGYWQGTATVPAGQHTITLKNKGDTATCSVRSQPLAASATCKGWTSWRSPNTDHTHLRVGVEAISAGWEAFPASGNHWGAWAPWNKVYPKAIKRGFLLHNLEHGGVVFSYKCSAASDSAECKSEQDALVALSNSLGFGRVLITPDPTQPTKFAVRTWRYAWTGDCLDTSAA